VPANPTSDCLQTYESARDKMCGLICHVILSLQDRYKSRPMTNPLYHMAQPTKSWNTFRIKQIQKFLCRVWCHLSFALYSLVFVSFAQGSWTVCETACATHFLITLFFTRRLSLFVTFHNFSSVIYRNINKTNVLLDILKLRRARTPGKTQQIYRLMRSMC